MPSRSTSDKNVTEINSAKLCQGCGTCVAACPANAISGTGFSNEQILSQIDGLLANSGIQCTPAFEPDEPVEVTA